MLAFAVRCNICDIDVYDDGWAGAGSAQSTRSVRAAERRRAVAAETRGRVVVTVAPNGGRKTKADHPALPLTADELARTAAECLERGASMIHLHVRDKDGGHCLDPEAYRSVIARICEEVGDRLVLQITSESLGRYSPAEQRAAVLRTNPEAVSLALRELAPGEDRREGLRPVPGQAQADADLAADHPLSPRRGRAPGGDAEAGADPVRQALGSLRARAVRADPHRDPARPPALSRPGHAAVRNHGACAPSAAARPPASPPRRCSAGTCGSASRTTLRSPTAPAPPPTPSWSARRSRALEAVGLATQTAEGLREEIAAALGTASSRTAGRAPPLTRSAAR